MCDIPHLPAYQDVLLKLKGLTFIGEHFRFGSLKSDGTKAMEENFNEIKQKQKQNKMKRNKSVHVCGGRIENSHENITETVMDNQTVTTLAMSGSMNQF